VHVRAFWLAVVRWRTRRRSRRRWRRRRLSPRRRRLLAHLLLRLPAHRLRRPRLSTWRDSATARMWAQRCKRPRAASKQSLARRCTLLRRIDRSSEGRARRRHNRVAFRPPSLRSGWRPLRGGECIFRDVHLLAPRGYAAAYVVVEPGFHTRTISRSRSSSLRRVVVLSCGRPRARRRRCRPPFDVSERSLFFVLEHELRAHRVCAG